MDPKTEKVGVPQLHHHLSRSSALDRLAAAGRIIPAARLDLTELGPPPEVPHAMSMSEALAEQRRDE